MATRAQIDKVINKHKSDIDALEASWIASNSKYKQYKRGAINDSVEVHEYIRPDGGVGDVIRIFAEESNKEYVKWIAVGDENIPNQNTWFLLEYE
jgi:hypothetical protein